MSNGFFAIEDELRNRREQIESVKEKDTPYRVEFRYSGGTRHYQYFVSLNDAVEARDSLCTYGPLGNAIICRPSSQIIESRGPRGGWNRVRIHSTDTCSVCRRIVVNGQWHNHPCE